MDIDFIIKSIDINAFERKLIHVMEQEAIEKTKRDVDKILNIFNLSKNSYTIRKIVSPWFLFIDAFNIFTLNQKEEEIWFANEEIVYEDMIFFVKKHMPEYYEKFDAIIEEALKGNNDAKKFLTKIYRIGYNNTNRIWNLIKQTLVEEIKTKINTIDEIKNITIKESDKCLSIYIK